MWPACWAIWRPCAGPTDAGQPIRFTPHDFRRLFATDAVNNGLPLHIAAALLGQLNLDTTRGYTAVFPEHIVTAHQGFIQRRRELRPTGEDRVAEPDEWAEFQEHFLLRRVALGERHRPTEPDAFTSTPAPAAGSCASIRPSSAGSRR